MSDAVMTIEGLFITLPLKHKVYLIDRLQDRLTEALKASTMDVLSASSLILRAELEERLGLASSAVTVDLLFVLYALAREGVISFEDEVIKLLQAEQ